MKEGIRQDEGARKGIRKRKRSPWKSPLTPDSFTICLHVCTIFIGGSPLAAAACACEFRIRCKDK